MLMATLFSQSNIKTRPPKKLSANFQAKKKIHIEAHNRSIENTSSFGWEKFQKCAHVPDVYPARVMWNMRQ